MRTIKNLDPRGSMRKAIKKKKLITLKEAAKLSGYAPDYVGYLIRKGKIKGKAISLRKAWFTTAQAIDKYQAEKKAKKKPRILKRKKPRIFWYRRIANTFLRSPRFALPILIFLLIGFSTLTIYAISSKEVKIEIFPTVWQGEWQNGQNALSRELNAEATLAEFNSENSAFLNVPEIISPTLPLEEEIPPEEEAPSEEEELPSEEEAPLQGEEEPPLEEPPLEEQPQEEVSEQPPSEELTEEEPLEEEFQEEEIPLEELLEEPSQEESLPSSEEQPPPEESQPEEQSFLEKFFSWFSFLPWASAQEIEPEDINDTEQASDMEQGTGEPADEGTGEQGDEGVEEQVSEEEEVSEEEIPELPAPDDEPPLEESVETEELVEEQVEEPVEESVEEPVEETPSEEIPTEEETSPEETLPPEEEIILPTVDGELPGEVSPPAGEAEAEEQVLEEPEDIEEFEEEAVTIFLNQSSITYSGFVLPEEKGILKGARVGFSFAAEGREGEDDEILVDWSLDGENWNNLVTLQQNQEYSNALNGGYFYFELPSGFNWENLENLKIKFTALTNNPQGEELSIYLDSVWVEVNYQEKEEEEEEEEFVLNIIKKDWRADEEPEFEIIQINQNFLENLVGQISEVFEEQPKVDANLISPDDEELRLQEGEDFSAETHSPTKIKIFKLRDFRPGLYKLKITFERKGKIFTFEQEFTWGVLAINTNKSIYLPGEEAYLQMAVLDDQGQMVCDADVTLEITFPSGEPTVLKTSEGTIVINPECKIHDVTNRPDYEAYYTTEEVRAYQITLTAITQSGTRSVTDSFEVRESVPFDVERQGPTRILPTEFYTMQFIIKANQDFAGEVKETVPSSFEINPQIIWQVDWKQGETYQLSYQFDAPDVSPYLYLLGPLEFQEYKVQNIEHEENQVIPNPYILNPIFSEARKWQIASDTPTTARSPTASANNDTWTNPDNMHSQATGNATGDKGSTVDQITFGFDTEIPADALSIDGVTVEIDCFKTGTDNNTLTVNIVGAGTCTAKVTATLTDVDDDTYNVSLGGAADTWSCDAFTVVNVRATSFGVSIATSKGAGGWPADDSWLVDHVRVTVEYTEAATITVSGGCFTDDTEATPCTDDGSDEIKVAVNGSVETNSDTTVDGSWSFTINEPASGATMVFFRNGEATESEEATTVTKYDGDGGDVTLVKMYQNQLVIGTDSGSANSDQTVSIADMDTDANGYEWSDDEDVMFDVTAGDLVVDGNGDYSTETLYVISGDTYRPASAGGGDTTTHHLKFEGTLTTDNNFVNVAGDFTNAGTFTSSNSIITFNGSTAQTFTTNGATYNAVILNNTGTDGANDNVTISGALDVNADFSITNGDLILNSGDPNVNTAGNVSLGSSAFITKGAGTWTFDGTIQSLSSTASGQDFGTVTIGPSTTTTVNALPPGMNVIVTNLTINGDDELDITSSTLTITGSGTPFTQSGTFTVSGSTVKYTADGATNITATTYNNLEFSPTITASRVYTGAGVINVGGTLNINPSAGSSLSLTFNLGNTTSVTGATTIQRTSSATSVLDTTGSDHAFNTGSLSIQAGATLTGNGSALDSNGDVSVEGDGILTSTSGDFNVGGSWEILDVGVFTHSFGTVIFDATVSGKTIDAGSSSFFHVEFDGTNGVWSPLTNTMTITGQLRMIDGTFDTSSGTANVTVTGSVRCSGTCGTISMSSTNTFTQSVISDQNFAPDFAGDNDWTFYNLTFDSSSGARTITFNGTNTGTITVYNDLTLTNNGTSLIVDNNTNDRILDVNNDVSIGANTTLSSAPTASFTVGGNWANSGSFNHNSGTVTFDATDSGHTIDAGSSSFSSVTFDGTNGVWSPLTNTMTITGDLTMTNGTFDTSSGTANVTVNGNVQCGASCGSINMSSTNTFEQRVSTDKNFGTNTGASSWLFYNLTFSNSNAGATPVTITTLTSGNGGIMVYSILKIGGDADASGATTTLSAANRTWTISGSSGNPFQKRETDPIGDLVPVGSKFYYSGDNGAGNTIIQSETYNNLEVNDGSETYILEGVTIAFDVDIMNGCILDLNGNALTATNDLGVYSGALQGAANVTVNGTVTGTGTINLSGGTFEQEVAADENFGSTADSDWTFNNLKFNNSDGGSGHTISPNVGGTADIIVSDTLTLGDSGTQTITFDNETSNDLAFDINGSILISSQGIFSASSTASFQVAGNFTDNKTGGGGFIANSGTVTFDTTGTSIFDGSGTPAITFNNFTSTTPNKTLQFTTGKTFRIDGKFTIEGDSSNQIVINSTTSSQWFINHQGTEDVTYAHITNSGCDGSSTNISLNDTSTDNGNNGSCWLFPSLSFTLDAISRSINLTSPNFTSTATTTLTVTARAGLGYNLTAFETDDLRHTANAAVTILDWTGTYETPTAWTGTCIGASECGWGYNTDDVDVGFGSNYAAFAPLADAPGDIVATSSGAVTDDVTTITYRASVSAIQEAGPYQTIIRYILTPQF